MRATLVLLLTALAGPRLAAQEWPGGWESLDVEHAGG